MSTSYSKTSKTTKVICDSPAELLQSMPHMQQSESLYCLKCSMPDRKKEQPSAFLIIVIKEVVYIRKHFTVEYAVLLTSLSCLTFVFVNSGVRICHNLSCYRLSQTIHCMQLLVLIV